MSASSVCSAAWLQWGWESAGFDWSNLTKPRRRSCCKPTVAGAAPCMLKDKPAFYQAALFLTL